jgi:hypothetical protein
VTSATGSVGGSIRGYLCPLSVLLAFAIGVLVLSIILPRVQERRQGFESLQPAGTAYGVMSSDVPASAPAPGSGVPEPASSASPPEETT